MAYKFQWEGLIHIPLYSIFLTGLQNKAQHWSSPNLDTSYWFKIDLMWVLAVFHCDVAKKKSTASWDGGGIEEINSKIAVKKTWETSSAGERLLIWELIYEEWWDWILEMPWKNFALLSFHAPDISFLKWGEWWCLIHKCIAKVTHKHTRFQTSQCWIHPRYPW